jgi:hypothetical protein
LPTSAQRNQGRLYHKQACAASQSMMCYTLIKDIFRKEDMLYGFSSVACVCGRSVSFMTDRFGIPQVMEYIEQMGIKIARVDNEQEIIEMAFFGDHGQWRMIVGFQQEDEARKMMLLIPHIGTVTADRRIECLEALMAANYRIALGKFGLDLDDGEIRLEEVIPVANGTISFEQFQLAFGSLLQIAIIYQTLLHRIVFGNLAPEEALNRCEQEFLDESARPALTNEESKSAGRTAEKPELNIDDVMAEVTRLLEEHKE